MFCSGSSSGWDSSFRGSSSPASNRRSRPDVRRLSAPKPDLRDAASAYEPLLPIEKKRIGSSLGLGLALLALLVIIDRVVPLNQRRRCALASGGIA